MPDIDDLLSIWEKRREEGQVITAEELCREYPDLLEEVQSQIRVILDLEPAEQYFGRTDSKKDFDTKPDVERIRRRIDLPVNVSTRLQVERHHASGGLGDVFVAVDPVLNRKVAVKFPRTMRMSGEQRTRFEREARVTGKLDHPGIVAVHALKQDDEDQSCYIMRFVDGPTLSDRCKELHQKWDVQKNLNRFATMEFRRMLEQFVSLCDIAAYAHTQGVIHRDIKPANVILGPFGEVLLMDWGLARVEGEQLAKEENAAVDSDMLLSENHLTKTGHVLGTPAFAAPEQLLGHVSRIDQRSDVFSLGATLCFLFSGVTPVERSELPKHLERISNSPDSPFSIASAVPAALAAICRVASAAKPEARYQSASELADDIRRYLANEPVKVIRETLTSKFLRWIRNHPTRSMAIVVSMILISLFSTIGLLTLGHFNRQLEGSYEELSQAKEELEKSIEAESRARTQAQSNLTAATNAVKKYLVTIADDEMLKAHDFSELRKSLLESASPFFEVLRDQQSGSKEVEQIRAQALYSLGEIQLELDNPGDALSNLKNCVETADTLVKTDPSNKDFQFGLSEGLLKYGEALLAQGKREDGKKVFQRATELRERLAQTYPEYRLGLAEVYGLNGLIALKGGDLAVAKDMLGRSIELGQKLLAEDPIDQKVRERLASDLFNFGLFKGDRKQVENSISIYDKLAEEFPKVHKYRFWQAVARNGVMKWLDMDAKAANFDEILSIQSKLVGDFPSIASYQSALGQFHHSFAAQLLGNNEIEKAARHFELAMRSRKRLVDRFPDSIEYATMLGGSYCALGTIANINKKSKEALAWYLKAEELLRDNLEKSPGEQQLLNFLSQTYSGKAKTLTLMGKFDDAIPVWNEAAGLVNGPMKEFYLQRAADSLHLADLMEELTNKRTTSSAEQRIELAKACVERKLFRLAASEYWSVFHLNPELAAANRLEAVRCACLVIANQSEEPEPTAVNAISDFREWARQWLSEEFDSIVSQPKGKQEFAKWLQDKSLAIVREETAITKMPPHERERWEAFWARVKTALEAD